MNFRTDLAIENKQMYDENNNVEISGVEVEREEKDNIVVTRIKVTDEHGSQIMGKPMGNYITIEMPGIRNADAEIKDKGSLTLANELKRLIGFKEDLKVMIVGLGNEKVTPDSLGPVTVSKIKVTRHYFLAFKKETDETMSSVSALIPGVMGTTGIESVDLIKGAVSVVEPDVIIAVDALAARDVERINTTIQICDTGINPGAGVGNNRAEINEKTIGAKVIAIGVPTVIDSSAMIFDTLMNMDSNNGKSKISKQINKLIDLMESNPKEADEIIREFSGRMIVTSSDVDKIINDFSQIISNSINITLHPGLKLEDVNKYLN